MIYLLVIFLVILLYQELRIKKLKKIDNTNKMVVASIIHDIKSPASAQINMLNLLLKGQFGTLNPQQYEMLNLTCNSSRYISNLVLTILTDYECSSTQFKLNKTEFNLIELVNFVTLSNKYLAISKKQHIIVNHKTGSCYINADKLQIERVLSNLISNALIYGVKNSDILIDIIKEGDFINFSITNKSQYLKPDEIENIFDKFYKASNSVLNKNSSGLGLYVAKKIIEMHQGKIYAKSFKEGICTFGFKLPNSKKLTSAFVQKK